MYDKTERPFDPLNYFEPASELEKSMTPMSISTDFMDDDPLKHVPMGPIE